MDKVYIKYTTTARSHPFRNHSFLGTTHFQWSAGLDKLHFPNMNSQLKIPKQRNAIGRPRAGNQSENNYRFRGTAVHLTYKGHLPFEDLKQLVFSLQKPCANATGRIQDPKWYSIVHESSDAENQYDHTHFAVEFQNKIDVRGTAFIFKPRCNRFFSTSDNLGRTEMPWSPDTPYFEPRFDIAWRQRDTDLFHLFCGANYMGENSPRELGWNFKYGCVCGGPPMDGINPNIVAITTEQHKVRIYEDYHRKDPVELEQSDQAPINSQGLFEEIRKQPTLWAAAEVAGVNLSTFKLHDIALLRQDTSATTIESKFKSFDWDLKVGPFRCLYLWGPSGFGKTEWACAKFNNPLFCSHLDNLKQFKPGVHDGIIFDDMSFAHLPRETCIAICDWDKPRQIHCRHYCANIPAEVKKIFLSNKPWEDSFPCDEHQAIYARFSHIIELKRPTFTRTADAVLHERPKTMRYQFTGPTTCPTEAGPPPIQPFARSFDPGPQLGHPMDPRGPTMAISDIDCFNDDVFDIPMEEIDAILALTDFD